MARFTGTDAVEVLRYAPWEVVSAVMGVALSLSRSVPTQSTRQNGSVYGFISAFGLATAPGYDARGLSAM